MKFFPLSILIGALIPGPLALAQTIPGGSLGSEPITLDGTPAPSPTPEKKTDDAAAAPAGPTTIDSENMDYDEKTRVAVFSGENYGVFLKDPQFTVNCDKLTAYMRKTATAGTPASTGPKGKGAAGKGSPAPTAKASPTPAVKASPAPAGKAPAPDAAASKGGGLQRAIAEGTAAHPVVIVQDKPASNGDQAQHNVGIAEKADYNADTGDVILTGWPRVSQGVNTQIATSEKTVMIMNKDGKTMKTSGPSRSIIQEQEKKDDDGKSGKAGKSPTP